MGIWYTCTNGRLTENIFKHISTNSNLNLIYSILNLKPNPKAQKRFRENEMTSFFGQVSRYRAMAYAR